MTRDGSLIGISDFLIPQTVLQKKQETFAKLCSVIMIDSTKRLLFGNISGNNTIRMNVNASITYFDKNPSLKQSHSLPKSELKKMALSPKVQSMKSAKMAELMKQSNSIQRETKTPPMHNIPKTTSSKKKSHSKSAYSINNNKPVASVFKASKANHNTNVPNTVKQENNPDLIYSSEIKELDPENDRRDVSVIDEMALVEIGNVDNEFKESSDKFLESHPLEEVNKGSLEEVKENTKNIINSILDYQKEYFTKVNKAIELRSSLKDLFNKYNEKYRGILKKSNRLHEQTQDNTVKKDITVNVNRKEVSNLKTNFIPLKSKEFEMYKLIFNLTYDSKQMENHKEESKEDLESSEEGKLLLKAARNVITKYGPLTKMNTSLDNSEKENLLKVITKYKLPNEEITNIKEESEEEVEEKENVPVQQYEQNVIAAQIDVNDVTLNNYLNNYYAKHKVPRVPFRKLSRNNYEYGNQKIMIKIEGETIRVRSIGGYSLIDKFIEMNARIEEIHINSKAAKGKGKK